MGKYLIQASYTQAGIQGVIKEGAKARAAAVTKAVKSVGGKVEALYWSFGAHDFVLVMDAPDHAAVVAVNAAVGASGGATTVTTVLLTAEDVDKARENLAAYRAPGA
ncbi:MAG: GYD domain-containing protein [Chloroflexota bacterium]